MPIRGVLVRSTLEEPIRSSRSVAVTSRAWCWLNMARSPAAPWNGAAPYGMSISKCMTTTALFRTLTYHSLGALYRARFGALQTFTERLYTEDVIS